MQSLDFAIDHWRAHPIARDDRKPIPGRQKELRREGRLTGRHDPCAREADENRETRSQTRRASADRNQILQPRPASRFKKTKDPASRGTKTHEARTAADGLSERHGRIRSGDRDGKNGGCFRWKHETKGWLTNWRRGNQGGMANPPGASLTRDQK
jgi:hypothetical protein